MKEEKVVTVQEQVCEEPQEMLLACRDWMLGGETYQWSREVAPNGDLVLKRW